MEFTAKEREEQGWKWRTVSKLSDGTETEEQLRRHGEFNDFTRYNEEEKSLEVLTNPKARTE